MIELSIEDFKQSLCMSIYVQSMIEEMYICLIKKKSDIAILFFFSKIKISSCIFHIATHLYQSRLCF